MSAPPGYRGEGPIRPRRERAAAQVSKHGSGEHDRLTGFNNVGLKKKRRGRRGGLLLLLSLAQLTGKR